MYTAFYFLPSLSHCFSFSITQLLFRRLSRYCKVSEKVKNPKGRMERRIQKISSLAVPGVSYQYFERVCSPVDRKMFVPQICLWNYSGKQKENSVFLPPTVSVDEVKWTNQRKKICFVLIFRVIAMIKNLRHPVHDTRTNGTRTIWQNPRQFRDYFPSARSTPSFSLYCSLQYNLNFTIRGKMIEK